MAPRSGIIAGKTVIIVQVQESIDKALNSISTKLGKFSANIGRLGLELFGGGLVGSIISKQITDTFKDFEDAILFLQTKLTASAKDFEILENRIRQLGRTTSFTAKEVAEAATVLAQGGLNAKETVDSLQATLDLARGGQITLTQSGDILINTMRSFGIETSRAGEVASQFVAAARLGTLDILNLKESIKEVLGTVRILNIDLPTTLALLTQMAERSLKGTKAGTSLNTALLNLASKAGVLKQTLGIILPQNLNGDTFLAFVDELYTKINKLGNLQRVAVLQRLFNIRGGRAITALDDLKKIADLRKQIAGAGDEARKAAKLMDSGFGGSIRRATSAVESLSITLGKLFSKALIPILEVVPAISANFERLAVANETLLIPLVLVPPALVGVGAGLLTLSFIGGKAAGIFGILARSVHTLTNTAFKGLNGQLVVLARTWGVFSNRVQRQGKGSSLTKKGGLFQRADEGLSALLLSPQKVAKGRSAGKIRPSSFVERVGKSEIRTLAILKKTSAVAIAVLEKGVLNLAKVFGVLDVAAVSLDKSFLSFVGRVRSIIAASSRFGDVYKGLSSRINTAARNISNLKNAFASVNNELTLGVNRFTKYQAEADLYSKKALAAVAAQDRQTLLRNQLKEVDTEFNKLVAAPVTGKRTKEVKKLEADRRRQLAILGRRRKQIQGELTTDLVDPEDLAKKADLSAALAERERANIEVQRKKRAGIAISLKQQKQELTLGLKQRKILGEARSRRNAITAGSLISQVPKSIGSVLKTFGSGIRSVLGGGVKLLVSAFKSLPKLLDNSITGLFRFFKASGGLALGLLRLANGVRRFVFSISGIFTIIELLILFGPKIGFIRDAFARLGEGFSKAFATIGGTINDLAPVFALFKKSFANIFAGEGELGIRGLIAGFTELANIVKSNLKIAFFQVVEAVAPLYDFLRRITLSLLEIASLVGSIFGATFSNIGNSIQGLTGGGAGGLLEGIVTGIKEALSPENMKTAFGFVGSVLIEMARIVNEMISNIFQVLNNLATFIQNAIVTFFRAISSGLQATGSSLPAQFSFIIDGLYKAAGAIEDAGDSLIPEAGANAKAAKEISKSFQDTSKRLDNVFTGFLDRLESIFGTPTEKVKEELKGRAGGLRVLAGSLFGESSSFTKGMFTAASALEKVANSIPELLSATEFGAKQSILEAKAAKAQAQAESERQARIQTQTNTPFGKAGGFIANLPGLLGQKAGQGLTSLFAPKQPFDFKQLGQSLLGIGKTAVAKADPVALLKAQKRNLNEEAGQLRKKISFEKLVARTADARGETLPEDEKAILTGLQQRLAANRQAFAALNAGVKPGRQQLPQGSLRDIVSATVGTFRQTRGNLLKVAGGKSIDQQQLDAMKQVVDNTGGPADSMVSILRDLSTRAQPFVFQ